jgi:hypothetical protein
MRGESIEVTEAQMPEIEPDGDCRNHTRDSLAKTTKYGSYVHTDREIGLGLAGSQKSLL